MTQNENAIHYWPERTLLAAEAAAWRTSARVHSEISARMAAHDHLRSNTERMVAHANAKGDPRSLAHAAAAERTLAESAEDLAGRMDAATGTCPEPVATLIVYPEPGGPAESWAAEALVHCEVAIPVLRVHGYGSRATAEDGLRELAERTSEYGEGASRQAALVRAAVAAVARGEFKLARTRVAGQPRPEGWEGC